jgi:MFS family permease
MVQNLHGGDDTNASFYAGILVSAFAIAEASTAMIWGSISDRVGRKPIVLMGLAGTALSSLLFGFSTKYWMALVARLIGGLLNGNVAVLQTMVAEMVKNPAHERM